MNAVRTYLPGLALIAGLILAACSAQTTAIPLPEESLPATQLAQPSITITQPAPTEVARPTASPASIIPLRLLGGQNVEDFGYIPWVLGECSAGELEIIDVTASSGQYFLRYALDGVEMIALAQSIGLGYRWSTSPEIIGLDWATVELGVLDAKGATSLVAHIYPHDNPDRQMPNLSLLVDGDRELVFELIAALEPAE